MNNDSERISIRVPKDLLKEFDEYSKNKGYQRRDKAIVDLIKCELSK